MGLTRVAFWGLLLIILTRVSQLRASVLYINANELQFPGLCNGTADVAISQVLVGVPIVCEQFTGLDTTKLHLAQNIRFSFEAKAGTTTGYLPANLIINGGNSPLSRPGQRAQITGTRLLQTYGNLNANDTWGFPFVTEAQLLTAKFKFQFATTISDLEMRNIFLLVKPSFNISITSLEPASVPAVGTGSITITGSGFLAQVDNRNPVCKIGTQIVPATIISDTTAVCATSGGQDGAIVDVFFSLDGSTFDQNDLHVQFDAAITSPPANNLNNNNAPSNIGAIVGGVVGGVVVIAVIIAVIIFMFLCYRRPRSSYNLAVVPSLENPAVVARGSVTKPKKNPYAHTGFAIDESELEFDVMIGEGGFGRVYRGTWKSTKVAIKVLKQSTKEALDEFVGEMELMKKVGHHPNLVQFLGVAFQGPNAVMVSEFCEGGSLQDYLYNKSNPTLKNSQIVSLLHGIASGMAYLASQEICHRDLAARNILLTKDFVPKISDLGLSRFLPKDHTSQVTKSDVGPLKWMSPESIVQRMYSEKTDVWAFGIVLIEIVTREEPYPDLDSVQVAARVGMKDLAPALPQNASPYFHELLTFCCNANSKDRPSFKQLVATLADSIDAH